MVRRGIHTVPTMVSQMRPLFHTSTVRPRSSRLISLGMQERRQVNPLPGSPLGPPQPLPVLSTPRLRWVPQGWDQGEHRQWGTCPWWGDRGEQQGWGTLGWPLGTHNMKSCSQEGRLPRTAMVVLLTFCTFSVT